VDRIRNPLAAARAFCELMGDVGDVGDDVYEKVISNMTE